MRKLTTIAAASVLTAASQQALAADLTIEIQNLTQGIYFTPVLVAAHSPDISLFEVGEAASAELTQMAEGGSLEGLMAAASAGSADMANVEGLTGPSEKKTLNITNAEGNTVLSVAGMILPSNDGFVGLDNWTIPTEAGTYTVYLNAYDAGTEANDEIRGSGAPGMPGMPVPPPLEDKVGTNGTGVTDTETNATVHIHRGSIGDSALDGGNSDIVNNVHRWLNPVAKVTVTVN